MDSGRTDQLRESRSAVASTTTGETGEAEECHRTRSGDVDDETGLLAGSAKTLVPSDLQGRTREVEVAGVREATDENTEASGTVANLAIEARGVAVVPTRECAGVGSGVATKVRVEPRTGTSTNYLSGVHVAEATHGDERVSASESWGIEGCTEVVRGPAGTGEALEVR